LPDLFNKLPLTSKSEPSSINRFVRTLLGILEIAPLNPISFGVYEGLLSFLDVPCRLEEMLSLQKSQNAIERMRRGIEVYIHGVLQTDPLREMLSAAIGACTSYLDNEVERVRLSRTDRSTMYDLPRREASALRSSAPEDTTRDTDPKISTPLQTVSNWLDSFQDLLTSGLIKDIKLICSDLLRHRNTSDANLRKKTEFVEESSRIEPIGSEYIFCEKYRQTLSSFIDGKVDSYLFSEKSSRRDCSIPDDAIHALAREAVRRQVEIELFLPLERGIRMVISDQYFEQDCIVAENILKLKDKQQDFFGIPKSLQSPSNWRDVCVILNELFLRSIPFDRIEVLKAAIKEIPNVYAREVLAVSKNSPKQPQYISADDMLPIFVYLLATSNLPFGLCSLSLEINSLCDQQLKISEIGYVLATFEASVHHLTEMDDFHLRDDSSSFYFVENKLRDSLTADNPDVATL
jgi:hypothetical protein